MICDFCGNDNAAGYPVATKLGRAAVLCEQCQAEHGVQPRCKPKWPSKAKKKGRRSSYSPAQTVFFFYHSVETDGPADAAIS